MHSRIYRYVLKIIKFPENLDFSFHGIKILQQTQSFSFFIQREESTNKISQVLTDFEFSTRMIFSADLVLNIVSDCLDFKSIFYSKL